MCRADVVVVGQTRKRERAVVAAVTVVVVVAVAVVVAVVVFVVVVFKDAHFFTWNPQFSGEQPFSACPTIFPCFLSFQEKRASFRGGTKKTSPGGPCTTLSMSIRFVPTSEQSFSVIFTPRSNGRAECECLSYIHRFQLGFHLFMPSWFRPAAVHRVLETHYQVLLCSADSDI